MRVCPKCGFIDPPHWKHCKFSYHIDSIDFESFEMLYPKLAKNLKKGGDITEDKDYYYRLTKKSKAFVHRKAKIEWTEGRDPFGAEKYEKFNHNKSPYVNENPKLRPKYWGYANNVNQRCLLEEPAN